MVPLKRSHRIALFLSRVLSLGVSLYACIVVTDMLFAYSLRLPWYVGVLETSSGDLALAIGVGVGLIAGILVSALVVRRLSLRFTDRP